MKIERKSNEDRRLCVVCGLAFKKQNYGNGKEKVACSSQCGMKLTARRNIATNSARKIPCMCQFCGSVKLLTEYKAHGKGCFCDGECYLNWRKLSVPMYRVEIATESDGRTCEFCGGKLHGKKATKFCSQACIQSRFKKERIVRKKCNGPYDVISLDAIAGDWLCNGCGCKCVKSTGNNSGFDATIDHIIPLAKGGTHTLDNVQLLCRTCNTQKRDRLEPGTQLQLALV